jgi:hypothetical protein
VKFAAAQAVAVTGLLRLSDTIAVSQGWNLIGSLSAPIPVGSISSDPGGLVTSNFFGYQGTYATAAALEPGQGYWVKVSGAGELILNGTAAAAAANRIRIQDTGERPPAPPDDATLADNTLPKEFGLSQNYPNPFNPTTTLAFQLPVDSRVKLVVYDVMGRTVATLADEVMGAGYKSMAWDAARVASGVYFYRVDATALEDPARSFTQVKKMLLLR